MSYLNKLVSELSSLKLNVDYWDVRVEDTFETNLLLTDGEVVSCTANPSVGAFIRVRKNSFWFYESTTEIKDLKSIIERLARLETKNQGTDSFSAEVQPPHIAMNSTETKFSAVPLEKKLELAKLYDAVLAKVEKIASRTIRYKDVYKTKSYLNSVGTRFEFDFNQGGFICAFTLKDQKALFDDFMRIYGTDFSELVGREADLQKFAVEAQKFLNAKAIIPGKYKVVLDPEVAGVFTHESFGHKSEADFMLGNSEALEEWKLGKQIGSNCLTIVDRGSHVGTSGYCPIDDDGTPAQKNYLIRNGVLESRLHSRETAFQLGEKPTGNSRAMSFEFEPIVRMTSTYIEPGIEPFTEILARSEGALYVEGVKHGSGLSTFTIAPTRGYLIGKNGALEPVRLTVISESVFETLKNIEAVSKEFMLQSGAIGGCGKMEQWPLPVASGGPYVVVSEMQVS